MCSAWDFEGGDEGAGDYRVYDGLLYAGGCEYFVNEGFGGKEMKKGEVDCVLWGFVEGGDMCDEIKNE